MATKAFRCLLCNPHKHFSSSGGYKHLDETHKVAHELGVSHDYVDDHKPDGFFKDRGKAKQYECLLCPAGSRKTGIYSTIYNHVTDHHGEKAKIDVTHREVGGVSYIPEKVEEVKTLPYHELRCILRIDKETGERILILGG